MKIAIVAQPFGNVFLPWTGLAGSVDIWIYETARRLARSCDVIVYTRRDRHSRQKEVEQDSGVQYLRILTTLDEWYGYSSSAFDRLERLPGLQSFSRHSRHFIFLHNSRRPLFSSNFYYSTYIHQIARDLKKEKCDVVHIMNFSQFVPVIRAFNPKIRIVLNMRCEWLTQLDRRMIKKRLRDVDQVVGCSEYITNTIRCHFPEFAKRCWTALNGVDTDQFVPGSNPNSVEQNDAKRLLFVGRVSPEKGLHVLLSAFRKVVDLYPNAQLEIIGPNASLPEEFLLTLGDDEKLQELASSCGGNPRAYFPLLQKQVLTLGLERNVIFRGFVPNLQMVKHYQNADILVNPSFSESFGRSLIEAMACQVPVVATRVGGMTEIVDEGNTGILVKPGDAPALGEAMLRLLSEEGLRTRMGEAARERAVELFSWESIARNLLDNYRRICDGNE